MRRALTLLLLALSLAMSGMFLGRAQESGPKTADGPRHISDSPSKCVEIGDFYFKRKSYAGALSRYKEAIRGDPDYAPAYLGLGRVFEKMGQKRKALQANQRYLDELPSDKQAEEATDVHRAIARLQKELAHPSVKSAKPR